MSAVVPTGMVRSDQGSGHRIPSRRDQEWAGVDPEGLGLGSSVMAVPPSWAAASRPGISRAQLVITGGQIRAAALSTGHESRRRRLIAQKKIRITASNHNGMMVEQ